MEKQCCTEYLGYSVAVCDHLRLQGVWFQCRVSSVGHPCRTGRQLALSVEGTDSSVVRNVRRSTSYRTAKFGSFTTSSAIQKVFATDRRQVTPAWRRNSGTFAHFIAIIRPNQRTATTVYQIRSMSSSFLYSDSPKLFPLCKMFAESRSLSENEFPSALFLLRRDAGSTDICSCSRQLATYNQSF